MYEVDAEGVKDASTQRDYKGIVNSSTTINNLTVRGGADRTFPIGAKVICAPTAAWADDLVAGLVQDHDQSGQHKDLTDANGNEWIKQTATASAVNEVTVANAATGNAPVISATGDDTNIDLSIKAKGSGTVQPGRPVAFSGTMSSAQSLANATAVKLQVNTEDFDYGGNFDTSTYRYTAPYDGVYRVDYNLLLENIGTDKLTFNYIYVNGSAVRQMKMTTTSNPDDAHASFSVMLNLSASDYIEFYAYQNSGGSINVNNSSLYTHFGVELIGRTD